MLRLMCAVKYSMVAATLTICPWLDLKIGTYAKYGEPDQKNDGKIWLADPLEALESKVQGRRRE